jgi:hypothetical protein
MRFPFHGSFMTWKQTKFTGKRQAMSDESSQVTLGHDKRN